MPSDYPIRSVCLAVLALVSAVSAEAATVDTVIFGDGNSETAHSFTAVKTETTSSASLGQPAQRCLPLDTVGVNGGDMTFTMAVDPVRRNYFSVKLWGGDDTNIAMGRLYLYVPVDGVNYQVGYRHEGDYMPLSVAGDMSPLPGRFFYSTTLLPLSMTKGKTNLTVKVVSTGWLYGLGSGGWVGDGGNYQNSMTTNSRWIYRAYTHNDPFLEVSGETQGSAPTSTNRATAGEETLASGGAFFNGVNNRINNRLNTAIAYTYTTNTNTGVVTTAVNNFTTSDVAFLAHSHAITNLAGYANTNVINKVVALLDAFATEFYSNPSASVYGGGNEGWGGRYGCLGQAIFYLSNNLTSSVLDATNNYAAGGTVARRAAWGDMLHASREYGRKSSRRTLSNQTILANHNIYGANKGLIILNDSRKFSEDIAQRYIKEACGLLPWLGNDLSANSTGLPADGTAKTYGSSYYQVTPKGLTREWGYVGAGYGEMAYHVAEWYRMTGNEDFKTQMVKMAKARGPFRRPAFEVSGSLYYNTMEVIGLLAWRGAWECDGYYTGYVGYADTADSNEGGKGLRVASASGDSTLLGYAKQMVSDGQFFTYLTKSSGYYNTIEALDTFADYQVVKPAAAVKLPMADGQADFAWADEQNGIVALKQGSDRLWVAPYWQAKTGTGINGVARFHYSTTNYDQYGVLETVPQFKVSSYYTRPNYVDKPEAVGYVPPDNPRNAYAGETIPTGLVPADARDGAPFIGRADFYAFRFGKYLFGVNTSTNSYELKLPSSGFTSGSTTNLITRTTVATNTNGMLTVGATNSAVLYLSSATETNAIPQPPLLVTAAGNSTPAVVVNWTDSSGADFYTVKRSTTQSGPYTEIVDAEGSSVSGGLADTTFTDTYVTTGAPYYYVVSASNPSGTSYDSMEASASAGLPSPWSAVDVGAASVPGTSSFIDKVFTLSGSGSDVGGTADSFHFVSMTNSGDGSLIARLVSRTQGGSLNDKMGLMIRQDNSSAGSPMFAVYFDGGSDPDKAKVSYRSSAGGNTTVLYGDQKALPQWLKVTRSGSTYTGYISSDGATWTQVGSATFAMNSTLQFGMFVCSRDTAALNTSMFDGVSAPNGWGYKPDAPSGLNAIAGPGSAGLSWSAVTGAAQYMIKRATGTGGPYTAVGTSTGTNYSDSGLTNGTTYYYVVSALNTNGESGNSNEVEVTPLLGPPTSPTGLAAVAGNGSVNLSWTASYQATGYNVKRSTSSAGPFTAIAEGIAATSFTDSSVANGTTYFYLVTALGPGGESGNSAVVTATPSAVPPTPLGLQAIAGNASAVLAWPPSLGATTYNLRRSTSATGTYTMIGAGLTATSYTDNGLTNGTTYYYKLSALNATGESFNSSAVSVVPSTTVMHSPYTFQDIGAVGIKGGASRSGGTFTMVASGADIWNTSDEFSYVYVPMNGDGIVTAKVASLQNVNSSAKAGVMIRETLDANSKYAIAAMTPGGTFLLQYRSTAGATAAQVASSSRTIPYWVRLVRNGNTITAYRSSSGSRWSQVGTSLTISMSTRVYVGLALSSHDDTKTTSATFSNFTVSSSGTLGAPSGLTVTSSGSSVSLIWSALTGATSYNIERATSADGTYATIASGVTGTTYTDSTAVSGTTYYYRISAKGSAGDGWSSGSVAAIPKNWAPAALSAVGGNGEVLLSWTAVADAEGYRVLRSTSLGGAYESVSVLTGADFIDSTVTNGTKYYYKVTTMRGGAEGEASSVASATPQNASTGLSGTWANVSLTTNSLRYNFTTTKSNTSIVVTDAGGAPHTFGVGDLVSPINAVAGLGSRYCYWVVGTSSNTLSVSANPTGAPIAATATTTNTNSLRGSQRWSVGSNWTNGVIPSGVDAVATFPKGSLPLDVGAVLVDMDVILGKLVYSNASNFSDCTIVNTLTNSIRFAVSGANPLLTKPMIEVPYASAKWLQLGDLAVNANGPALRIAGSQGLLLRSSAGGAVTNGIGSNPAKDLSIQNVDWSGFSGGLVVDRGSLGPAASNRLPFQDLTLGTDYSATNNVLAGLKIGASQTIAALNGNSMGRVCGTGTLTVGTNDSGGEFAGIIGQQFNGIRDSNTVVKIGTNRQVMSGAMVGNGSADIAVGVLVFSGTGTNSFAGAVTVASNAALYMDSTHAAMAPFASVTLAGTSGSANFVSSVPLRNDDVVRVTAANAGLALATEYHVVGTPVAATTVQLATSNGGAPVSATSTANATAQFSSTTNGTGGMYVVAAGGTLGGGGRIAPFDTTGGTNVAISVSGQLAPGPDGTNAFGRMKFDGASCVRSLLKLEPGATVSFRVAVATNDSVVVTNAEAGDVAFTANVLNFTDPSDGSLPMQTVLFSADAAAYSGIATNANGVITNGVSIGTGLEAYPQAALYVRSNNIVLRLAPIPPPAPASLTAVGGDKHVALSWSAASGATNYAVYRSSTADGLFDSIAAGLTTTNYTDTSNLTAGTTYYYRVRSIGNTVESDDYAAASASTAASPKQAWRLQYFQTANGAGDAADAADPDRDGRVNMLEYAVGSNPTNAETAPPAAVALSTNGPRLAITFTRVADPALVYTVESADALVSTNAWTNAIWTSTGTNNTAGEVTVHDNVTTSEKIQRFLRLRVE